MPAASNRTRTETGVRVREDVVAGVVHKLRTPLTAALGFLQLALRDANRDGAEGRARHLEMVDEQLRRMAGMLDELAVRGK